MRQGVEELRGGGRRREMAREREGGGLRRVTINDCEMRIRRGSASVQ